MYRNKSKILIRPIEKRTPRSTHLYMNMRLDSPVNIKR